jgi:iron complex transport system substrate-binding protein
MLKLLKRILLLLSAALFVQAAHAKERVISLAPHLTEMMYALNAGDQLVGVMRFSDYPAEAKKLPVIGDAYALNYEQIVAAKPTLVLAWKGGTPEKQIEKLRSLKLNVEVINTDTLKDIPLSMANITRKLNVPDASMSVNTLFERDLKTLQTQYSNAKPVKVFYEIWSQPLMTIGSKHPINEAIELCGGVNVFKDIAQPVPTVSREALLTRKPQVLISAAGDDVKPQKSAGETLFPKLPHYTINGDLISRMGPRFLQGVKQMCEAIDAVRVGQK